MNKAVEFSVTDYLVIDQKDSSYLNAKGANYYRQGNYDHAVEYYHLAASMGNADAISNLGYCYLYGRHTEPNISVAIAYFKLASQSGNIDATYKLGNIYATAKWGMLDIELSLYYYRLAASYLLEEPFETYQDITWCQTLQNYPSLCLVLGKALLDGSQLIVNLDLAYQFLIFAKKGYLLELQNSGNYYQPMYEEVLELLEDSQFNSVRDNWDELFEE